MLEVHQVLHSEWERVNWEIKEGREKAEQYRQEKIELSLKIQELESRLNGLDFTEKKEPLDGVRITEVEVEEMRVQSNPESSILLSLSPDAPTVVNAKGAKQSATASRLDLLPGWAVLEIGRVMDHGARKYGDDNWRGIPTRDHINHALVHVFAYLAGDHSDDHLSHFATRALMALEMDLTNSRAQAEEDEYREGNNVD